MEEHLFLTARCIARLFRYFHCPNIYGFIYIIQFYIYSYSFILRNHLRDCYHHCRVLCRPTESWERKTSNVINRKQQQPIEILRSCLFPALYDFRFSCSSANNKQV